jgi:hypothetical protein
MTNAARASIAIASTASGCLAKSLAVDTQAILVVWQIDDRTPLGCVAGAEELPLLKIRSHIQSSPDPDDEYFDWVPCLVEDVPLEDAFRGQTTPLELGPYDVEVELWTWDRARVLARASQPHTALLDNTPPGPLTVEVTLVPVRAEPPAE